MCEQRESVRTLQEFDQSFRAMGITGYYFAPLVNTLERGKGLSQKVVEKVTIVNRLRCKINLDLIHFSDINVRNCFAVYKENFITSDPCFMDMSKMEVKSRIFNSHHPTNLKQAQWQATMNRFGYRTRGASIFELNDANPLLGVLVFFSDQAPETFTRNFEANRKAFDVTARALGNHLQTTLNNQANPWVALGAISRKSHQILLLLADGLDTTEIARIMSLTKRGVDYHIESLKELLQARNRVQLVVKALEEGIIGYPEPGHHEQVAPDTPCSHWQGLRQH